MNLWIEKLVKVNQYTRPGTKLASVKKIVMHYTANPGATALNHFNYFNGTAITQKRYASAHLFIDKDSAYLIIPLNEVAFHANDGSYRGVEALKPNANLKSIGIELCQEKDGSFHPNTIKRAAEIARFLCEKYKLNPTADIVRHYDVTKKNCPAHWVSNPALFTEFKALVANNKVIKNGWLKENNIWYFYDNSNKKTGWFKDNNKWYFLDASGAMKTGWVKDKGKWYYLNPAVGGPQGSMMVGVIEDKGKFYYLNADGSMAENSTVTVTLKASKDGSLTI